MSLPKEPRQKMINLMYLVLTALLALNVSNEILNAFKVVDNSLTNSNGVIKGSNETISASLAELSKDASKAEQVAVWRPKAEAAMSLSAKLATKIDEYKKMVKEESGLKIEDGVEDFKEDDLDAPTRLFGSEKGEKGLGAKFRQELSQFMTELQAIVPAEEQKKSPLPKLPLDLGIPKNPNPSEKQWTNTYFHMTPSVAAITILSKFQNDVLRSGNLIADYCQQKIGKVVVVLDRFEVLTSQSSSYLLPGQPLEIKAGIGTFSSTARPTITINGAAQALTDSGFARYSTTVSSSGSIPVVVNFTDPNTGKTITKSTNVNYTVGQASGASIFLTKMNVMYVGVDNPFTISSGSGKFEKTTVSFTGGPVTGSGADRIAKPTTTGPATLTINVEGKSYPFPIRCKTLPDPVPYVGQQSGGKTSAAQFRQMGGLRAALKDSDFDAPFRVVSYTMAGNGAGFSQYTPVNLTGAQWGSNSVISQCKPGSTVFFDDIVVVGPDGKNRKLSSIAFQLQ
jgi:gliding motility-associated protein GldM